MKIDPLVLVSALIVSTTALFGSFAQQPGQPPPLKNGMLYNELITLLEEQQKTIMYCPYANGPKGGILMDTSEDSNTYVPSAGSVKVEKDDSGTIKISQRPETTGMHVQIQLTQEGIQDASFLRASGARNQRSLNVFNLSEPNVLSNQQVIAILRACSGGHSQ